MLWAPQLTGEEDDGLASATEQKEGGSDALSPPMGEGRQWDGARGDAPAKESVCVEWEEGAAKLAGGYSPMEEA